MRGWVYGDNTVGCEGLGARGGREGDGGVERIKRVCRVRRAQNGVGLERALGAAARDVDRICERVPMDVFRLEHCPSIKSRTCIAHALHTFSVSTPLPFLLEHASATKRTQIASSISVVYHLSCMDGDTRCLRIYGRREVIGCRNAEEGAERRFLHACVQVG